MMLVLTSALAILVFAAHGLDETKLWKIPQPMEGFNWREQDLGRWYYKYRKVPCSWSGTNEFTDYESFISRESKNSLLFASRMRNALCNTITHRAIITSPGIYKIKDPTGDRFSGTYVYVTGVFKSFAIIYGCTKMSVLGDKCDDSSINVRTRMKFPDKKVISMINDALLQLWGITVDDLKQIKHNEPCFQQKPAVNFNKKWW